MTFTSYLYVFCVLPLTSWVLICTRKYSAQAFCISLTAFSFLIYATFEKSSLVLLMSTILLNYLFIRMNIALSISVTANVIVLILFKYIFSNLSVLGFIPLGISFFIFQQISALVDEHNKAPSDKTIGLMEYAAFVSFYPQLIAGPIVRVKDFIDQLRERSSNQQASLTIAFCFIVIGLFKKVVIADGIMNHIEPKMTSLRMLQDLDVSSIWSVNALFAFAIYKDFSGYSEMAVGIGLLVGLNLPQNFNSPFRQTDLAQLWRNWHMTVSQFIRDYLYFPLQKYMNKEIALFLSVFILSIWHGPTLNFAFFGIYQAAGIFVAKSWSSKVRVRMNPHLGNFLTVMFFVSSAPLFYIQTNDLTSLRVFAAQFQLTQFANVPWLEISIILSMYLFFKFAPNTHEYLILKKSKIQFSYSLFDAVLIFVVSMLALIFLQQSRGYVYFEF